MLRKSVCIIMLVLLVMAGCSEISKYDNDEVAAIVNDEEITVGDLRFLYPDDKALDYLEGTIQLVLVEQEVKKEGLDISENLDEDDWFATLPPKDTDDEGGKQIREYAESQAKKLNMEPDEFQKEYAEKVNERNAYLMTYLEEKLGEDAFDNVKNPSEFDEKANELLEELREANEDKIEVLIK